MGIELDQETARKARSIGLRVIDKDIIDCSFSPHTFDGVLAFEVVEHIQELKEFFCKINSSLEGKGLFGFTVPNYKKIYNYKNRGLKIYQDPPPIHLNFFTVESLLNILPKFGFEIAYLKVRNLPYMNWDNIETYKFLWKFFMGNFEGPTILCVCRKTKNLY